MRINILIFVFLIAFNCYSQNSKKLDAKNGFKNFRFGDSRGLYEGALVKDFGETYVYYHSSPQTLFSWKIEKTYLTFIKDKLVCIQVFFQDDAIIYRDLLLGLEEIFGKSKTTSFVVKKKENLIEYNEWDGDFVEMAIRRQSIPLEEVDSCDDCKIYITICNKKMRHKYLEDDF